MTQSRSEDPPKVSRRAALGTVARSQQRPDDVEVLAGCLDRRPDDGADASPRHCARILRAHLVQHRSGDGLSLRRTGPLNLRAFRVRRQREDEDAVAMPAGSVQQRPQRLEAEIRRGRHRVRAQGRGRVDVGVCVRLDGRADVTTLGIHQSETAGSANVSDDAFEDCDAGCAMALEECGLWFEHGDAVGHRFHRDAAEPLEPGWVIAKIPVPEQRRMRVDTDAQRAVRRDGGVQTRAEGSGGRLARHRCARSRDGACWSRPAVTRRGHNGPP